MHMAVTGEVAVVAVDHRDARADETRDRKHRNAGSERERGVGVAQVIEPADRFDAGGDLGGPPVTAAEDAEVDPAAARVRAARQRATLILHDVLGYRAGEVASMLESTEESVTSALKRARARLEQRFREEDDDASPPLPRSSEEQQVLGVLVAMFTEDVRLSMPPLPFEYRGLDAVTKSLTQARRRPRRLVPTRASGQPAFGIYVRDDRDGIFRAVGLLVVTFAGERVARLTRFETSVLPDFGLPRSLPS